MKELEHQEAEMGGAEINGLDQAMDPCNNNTLSTQWYTSPELFELEADRIFRRTWQCVGSVKQLSKQGDYFTTTVGGEPIVVFLDRSGTVRAMSSVCPHRGGPVASGEGHQQVPFFQCRYHAWSFNFDGGLRSAPGLDAGPEERATLCLPQFRVEIWRSMIFVNLDDAAKSLADQMLGAEDVLAGDPIGRLDFQFRETFEMKCNWKIFQYNSHECYHCHTIHPETVCNVAHPESLATLYRGEMWLHSRYEPKLRADAHGAVVHDLAAGPSYSGVEEHGMYAFHMFPNLMVAYTPPGYALLVRFIPQAPDRTFLVRDHYYGEADASKVASAKAFREAVIAEDIEICEAVQRNLSSTHFSRGRFVPSREWQSQWFEQRVRRFVGEDA
ncbi:MAG TPA: aromatic ring-hydroxylating dioxygenase subunit alpha [Nitrospira sp.]